MTAALVRVEPLGSACVPCLPATQRDPYIKLVSSMAGIVSLASAVARNTTQMLPLIATGASVCLGNKRVGGTKGVALLTQTK